MSVKQCIRAPPPKKKDQQYFVVHNFDRFSKQHRKTNVIAKLSIQMFSDSRNLYFYFALQNKMPNYPYNYSLLQNEPSAKTAVAFVFVKI